MHKYSHHLSNFTLLKNSFCLLILFSIAFTSCTRDESDNMNLPVLELKTDSIYVSSDTSIAEGSQLLLGIKASADKGDNICNLLITSNDSLRLLDYGFNASQIDKDVIINKNSDSIQCIKITIRNTNGLSTTKQIVLTKNGSAYKPIIFYPQIILGGQNNQLVGSFFSLNNGLIYSQKDAFQNQSLINLLYFYHPLEFNTLASPGANLTGIYQGLNSPEFWTIKNTTYFSRNIINIPISSFDNAVNDSIIIANTFTNGGRKAKGLAANQIWAFQSNLGKFGLIKIIEVNGQENGTLKIAVKMQQ